MNEWVIFRVVYFSGGSESVFTVLIIRAIFYVYIYIFHMAFSYIWNLPNKIII